MRKNGLTVRFINSFLTSIKFYLTKLEFCYAMAGWHSKSTPVQMPGEGLHIFCDIFKSQGGELCE